MDEAFFMNRLFKKNVLDDALDARTGSGLHFR